MTTTRRWWVFAPVCLVLFMGALDSLVVTTALPAIGRALHTRLSDLEWTVNVYTLVFTICMIPAAAMGDRFGHRRVLLGGVAHLTLRSARPWQRFPAARSCWPCLARCKGWGRPASPHSPSPF